MAGSIKIEVSERLADEIMEWSKEQRDLWPDDTPFQRDLAGLQRQLDARFPSADDVRGILTGTR